MRVVEVYAGAYASGKSETAVNRARQYSVLKKPITLVDLDSVEPAYTLRPIANELKEEGINVITQPDCFGLGEAASYVTPAQVNCLSNEGDIIIDVGYGAGGLDILDIVNNIDKEENLKIYLVVNTAKYETSTVDNIIEYIHFASGTGEYTEAGSEFSNLESENISDEHAASVSKTANQPYTGGKYKFCGMISNTHFGDETTKEDIINGYNRLKIVSERLGLPIRAIGADEKLAREFDLTYDGIDVWLYRRFMPKAFWN